MHLHSSTLLEALLGPLRAVRRRMRLQALLDGAARAALPAAVVALGGAGAARAGWPRVGMAALAGVACVIVTGAAWAAARRIPLAQVARRVDERHGLADRLQAALDFASRDAPTRFMRAAIDDALASARRAGATSTMARLASPLRRPEGLRGAAVLGAIAVLLLVVPLPAAERAGDAGSAAAARDNSAGRSLDAPASPPPREAPESIALVLLAPERAAAAELLAEERAAGDTDLARTPEQLLQLFDAIDQRHLSRREALDRLGALEIEPARDRDAWRDELRAAGEALERTRSTRSLGRALRRGDTAEARRELESLRSSPPRAQREAERELTAAMGQIRERAQRSASQRGAGDAGASSSTGNGTQRGTRDAPGSPDSSRSGSAEMGSGAGSGGGGSAASSRPGGAERTGHDGAGDSRGAGHDGAGDSRGASRDGAGDSRGAGHDGAGDSRGAGRDGARGSRGAGSDRATDTTAGRDGTGDGRTDGRDGAGDARGAGRNGAGSSPGAARDSAGDRRADGRDGRDGARDVRGTGRDGTSDAQAAGRDAAGRDRGAASAGAGSAPSDPPEQGSAALLDALLRRRDEAGRGRDLVWETREVLRRSGTERPAPSVGAPQVTSGSERSGAPRAQDDGAKNQAQRGSHADEAGRTSDGEAARAGDGDSDRTKSGGRDGRKVEQPGDRSRSGARGGRDGEQSGGGGSAEHCANPVPVPVPVPAPDSLGDFLSRSGDPQGTTKPRPAPATNGARPSADAGERAAERGGGDRGPVPWGDEHDPNLFGDPTQLDASHRAVRVSGRGGQPGPSRAETILRSSRRGFSGQAYRRVFSDYTAVADEFMAATAVPPGYRFFVERYFRLIRPRP